MTYTTRIQRRRKAVNGSSIHITVLVIASILSVQHIKTLAFVNSFSNNHNVQLISTSPTNSNQQHQSFSIMSFGKQISKHTNALYAVMQESDQREKKQQDEHQLSSAGCNGASKDDTSAERKKDDFTLHVGRALDTLRKEYPHLLTQSPDYTLYDEEICLSLDLPTSPFTALTYLSSISGITRYKMIWDMIHAALSIMYHTDQSYMSSIKLCHDRVRGNIIRVQWHAVLFPRWQSQNQLPHQPHDNNNVNHSPPPPSSKCHHIDAISVYELDWTSGKIIQHRVEQLVYTNHAQQPVVLMDEVLLRQSAKVIAGGTIPVHIDNRNTDIMKHQNMMVEFRSTPLYNTFRPTSLFAIEAEQPSKMQKASSTSPSTTTASGTTNEIVMNTNKAKDVSLEDTSSSVSSASTSSSLHDGLAIDMVAFDAKNKSRQKFGLKPLTIDEYVQIEHQVEQLAMAQQEAIKTAKILAQQVEAEKQASDTGPSIFEKVFGSVVKNLDTCESNFDCERPQVCCDYIFTKKCCTSGNLVLSNNNKQLQYARIPVYAGDGNKNGRDGRLPPSSPQYPISNQRYIQKITPSNMDR
jgi:hypothetical protein